MTTIDTRSTLSTSSTRAATTCSTAHGHRVLAPTAGVRGTALPVAGQPATGMRRALAGFGGTGFGAGAGYGTDISGTEKNDPGTLAWRPPIT